MSHVHIFGNSASSNWTGPAFPLSGLVPWSTFQGNRVIKTRSYSLLNLASPTPLPDNCQVPFCVGSGMVPAATGAMLTLRIQVGSTQRIVLADPQDPEVENLIRGYRAEALVGLSFQTPDNCRKAVFMENFPGFCPQLERLKEGAKGFPPEAFIANAAMTILSCDLARNATSDIPTVSRLDRVEVSILATKRIQVAASRIVLDDGEHAGFLDIPSGWLSPMNLH